MTRLAAAYCLVLIGLVLIADLGLLNAVGHFVEQYPVLDKVIHFVMYGVLALLANAALAGRRGWSVARAVATSSVIVLIASTAEEFSNVFTMHRTCSWGDLAANYLGIVCLGILPFLIRQPKPAAEQG